MVTPTGEFAVGPEMPTAQCLQKIPNVYNQGIPSKCLQMIPTRVYHPNV